MFVFWSNHHKKCNYISDSVSNWDNFQLMTAMARISDTKWYHMKREVSTYQLGQP